MPPSIQTQALERVIGGGDYTLVICEKPDAARKIADALGNEKIETLRFGRVEVHSVYGDGKRYIVCSASGHLYTIADTGRGRSVYPVYDVQWLPRHEVRSEKERPDLKRRIDTMMTLAIKAREFVNACDFDQEGETVGHNILRYACGGKQESASRAKFSTLTREELRYAIKNAERGLGGNMAEAGRTRHLIDFLYGINLSRALTQAYRSSKSGYKTLTIGRVQGPTIGFVVEREIEIRTHLPIPYWKVSAVLKKKEPKAKQMIANYEKEKIETKMEAVRITEECKGADARVEAIKRSVYHQRPPIPFNLGDLQREAYRRLRFDPSFTHSVAQRLYLEALITYPRTSSQKIPPTADCRKIISGLSKVRVFEDNARELLSRGKLIPNQGAMEDSAHPAIYPTGETPRKKLDSRVFRLYDLIVRRFFSLFGDDAIREEVSVLLRIKEYPFKITASGLVEEGWTRYSGRYVSKRKLKLPGLAEGEVLKVVGLNMEEKIGEPPPRFNQASLLEKMEKEGIGTKGTRAETIRTILERGYLNRGSMRATDLAFSVVEAMSVSSPLILSSKLTKEMEYALEDLERGEARSEEIVERAIERLDKSLSSFKASEIQLGSLLAASAKKDDLAEAKLGKCAICGEGDLVMITSRSTRKRFAACNNSRSCRASAPLPQRGAIRPLGKGCESCRWPMIQSSFRGRPWRFCLNMECPTKRVKRRGGG